MMTTQQQRDDRVRAFVEQFENEHPWWTLSMKLQDIVLAPLVILASPLILMWVLVTWLSGDSE